MSVIPIPENAVGKVGMVAALKRVAEQDVGKLVVVREPVGFVKALVGGTKPGFAWLVQALGEPIDCRGKPSRTVYVADRCLVPLTSITEAEAEKLIKAQNKDDFDSAVRESLRIIDANDVSEESLDGLLTKACSQALLSGALEQVATAVALKDIGFYAPQKDSDCLRWVGVHEGVELLINGGPDMFDRWHLIGTAVGKRNWTCHELVLRSEEKRGHVFREVLDIWRNAFGRDVVPNCLELGVIYEKHCEEMKILNPGLPKLSVDAKVFRAILKWLTPKYPDSDRSTPVAFSFSDRMLRIESDGKTFGCPADGHWFEECRVRLGDLLSIEKKIARRRDIVIEKTLSEILVTGLPIAVLSDTIDIPSKFPKGCRFAERLEGGFFVEFSDGSWFALSDDGKELLLRPLLGSRGPISEWYERTEADFFAEVRTVREWAERNIPPKPAP